MDMTEIMLDSRTIYEGRIITVRNDTVRLPDGKAAAREVVAHSGAVVVLPVDDNGEAVLVRQYRYAVKAALIEAPAGKLEKGEDPLVCAARELKEETGYTAGRIVSLGSIFSSPGVFDEVLHLYLAVDLQEGDACPDEGEFVEAVRIPLETLGGAVMRGEIRDAKTIAIIFMAEEYLKGEQT